MKLTDDHKVEIFCSALRATIEADAILAAVQVGKPNQTGTGPGFNIVNRASLIAAESIAKLQTKKWG